MVWNSNWFSRIFAMQNQNSYANVNNRNPSELKGVHQAAIKSLVDSSSLEKFSHSLVKDGNKLKEMGEKERDSFNAVLKSIQETLSNPSN